MTTRNITTQCTLTDKLKKRYDGVLDKKNKRHECKIENSNTNQQKVIPNSNTNEGKSNTKLSSKQLMVLDYCRCEAHTAQQIFAHLGIGKQAKHYDRYIRQLVNIGYLQDTTPERTRDKMYRTE